MTVGERIKTIRLKRGFTQKQLAERCKIDAANLRKYESGRQNPKMQTLEKIATALNVPLANLIVYYEEFEKIFENEQEEKMIEKYRKLIPKAQNKVAGYVDALYDLEDNIKDEYLHNTDTTPDDLAQTDPTPDNNDSE